MMVDHSLHGWLAGPSGSFALAFGGAVSISVLRFAPHLASPLEVYVTANQSEQTSP